MPEHVTVGVHGPVEPDDVGRVLAMHDVLFLPTLGENYGHVIAESLAQGTPVLISDRTPWRGLDVEGVGWDLPLDDSGDGFTTALRSLATMESSAYDAMRSRAAAYGRGRTDATEALEANRLLLSVTARASAGSVVPHEYVDHGRSGATP